MTYNPKGNMNTYDQPTLAPTYREMKFRVSWNQYQKMNQLSGQSGLAKSEIFRKLINVASITLLLQPEAMIEPGELEAVPVTEPEPNNDYPEWDCNCDPPVLGRQDGVCEVCGTLYNGKRLETKLEDYLPKEK